ncbi:MULTISPECIES: hypothetical protein [unclassified Roseateles]|uniref:hypothetical protein n=1 Tax=unclassified Roseateles TaxID=2626991 RepID=UPI0006F34099|nr:MULTISPECIES: hypothetical protein [unclassified Roseateles]KQW46704.1 hypothetical protein ASC81_10055 [Pelomonas sp. Root405]KRA73756.1 hypothetical protein ASD88_10055 [Pelomonas sp. Root662]
MTVKKPGFAERVFEFAFNAEYCAAHKAVLAACPYLPSQQQEKRLGYDVEIQTLVAGGAVSSLFLQHKVARHVDSRTGSNAKFYDAVGGPYFKFELDIEQYNLIHKAVQGGKQNFFYCAPAFTTRAEVDQHFATGSVVDNSVWIDVLNAGAITDARSHSIVYNLDASQVHRFSDQPVRATGGAPSEWRLDTGRIEKFDRDAVVEIYNDLLEDLNEWWPHRQKLRRKSEASESQLMPDHLPKVREVPDLAQAVEAVQELAVDYFGVSWLIGAIE